MRKRIKDCIMLSIGISVLTGIVMIRTIFPFMIP